MITLKTLLSEAGEEYEKKWSDADSYLSKVSQNQDSSELPEIRPMVHRNKVGAGAVVLAKSTGRLLFSFRRAIGIQPPMWNLWGGVVINETPEAAAKRYMMRQAGYTGPIRDSIELYTFSNQKTGLEYHSYLLVVDDEFEPHFNNTFILNAKWIEFGEWPAPMFSAVKELLMKSASKIKTEIGKYGSKKP